MDGRARQCCPECGRNRGTLGVAVLHVEKAFLSPASRFACFDCACTDSLFGQRSECEKPQEGDFLHFLSKFPRKGESR